MSESHSEVVEIQDIAAEDMEIILKYVYGMLDALPEERLHPLILAADRLQACSPSSIGTFDRDKTVDWGRQTPSMYGYTSTGAQEVKT